MASLSAEELLRQYQADPKGTKEKYDKKILDLSGTVEVVAMSYGDTAFVTFHGDGRSTTTVGAAMEDPEPWGKLSPGQKAKLRGICGFSPDPELNKAIIVEAGPNPAVVTTAEQLAAEYGANRKATTDKYADKYFIITGEIEKIEENEAGHISVYLKGDGKVRVACGFPGDSIHRKMALPLQPGQQVKVYGQFPGGLQKEGEVIVGFCYTITK